MKHLQYNFVLEDKYIYILDKKGNKHIISSPYLKVLKAKYEFKNKNYLIIQLDQDLDVDEKVENFIKEIRYADEFTKDILMNKSKEWYGKKWDIYTLDSMTRFPIDEQKGLLYMKLIIPKDDKDLNERIKTLEKILEKAYEEKRDLYISIHSYFKGIRWSREVFSEEWYLEDFKVLEEEKDFIDSLFNNHIDNVEENNIEENEIEEDKENILVEEDKENNLVEEDKENNLVEEVKENNLVEEIKENIQENEINIENENIIKENIENEIVKENIFIQENEENIVNNEIEKEEKNIIIEEESKEIRKKEKKSRKEHISSNISTTSSKRIKKRFLFDGKLVK